MFMKAVYTSKRSGQFNALYSSKREYSKRNIYCPNQANKT